MGFLPLIEAFLALGLTMIVLTTGVSSLAGTWQRLRRARARGLQSLLRCTFLLAVKNIEKPASAGSEDPWQTFCAQRDAPDALIGFVAEMCLQPTALADCAALTGDARRAAYRRLLPDLAPAEAPSNGDSGRDASVPSRMAHLADRLLHAFRRWRARAFTLDTLSDEEFRTRFTHSTLGAALCAADEAHFPARLDALNGQFIAYGHAASEAFAKDARLHSLCCAAGLVMLANIDAFNLLENYLAQPVLRAAIISRYEHAASGSSLPAGGATATTAVPAVASQFDAVLRNAADAARKAKDLPLANAIEQKALEMRTSIDTLQTARNEALQTVADATAGLPVGWDRYPFCAAGASDTRCRGLTPPSPATDADARLRTRIEVFVGRVGEVADVDAGNFLRWLAGLILTMVMLGLGTPFWVQAVNGLLRARDLVRGGNKAGDGPDGPPPAAAPPANR